MKTVKIDCFAVYDSADNNPEKYVLFSDQLEAYKYCDEMGEDFKVCSYTKEFKIYASKTEFDRLNGDYDYHHDVKKNIEAIHFVKFR